MSATTTEKRCRINRCGRPVGIGTHMAFGELTVQVCEEHWQANRDILPLPMSVMLSEAAAIQERSGVNPLAVGCPGDD